MSIETHVEALTAKHALLDETIASEMRRPNPDTVRLHSLKKQKLKLKEELHSFRRM